jgi:hypothetical protein
MRFGCINKKKINRGLEESHNHEEKQKSEGKAQKSTEMIILSLIFVPVLLLYCVGKCNKC